MTRSLLALFAASAFLASDALAQEVSELEQQVVHLEEEHLAGAAMENLRGRYGQSRGLASVVEAGLADLSDQVGMLWGQVSGNTEAIATIERKRELEKAAYQEQLKREELMVAQVQGIEGAVSTNAAAIDALRAAPQQDVGAALDLLIGDYTAAMLVPDDDGSLKMIYAKNQDEAALLEEVYGVPAFDLSTTDRRDVQACVLAGGVWLDTPNQCWTLGGIQLQLEANPNWGEDTSPSSPSNDWGYSY